MIVVRGDCVDQVYAELLEAGLSQAIPTSDSRLGPVRDMGPTVIELLPGNLHLLGLPSRAINPYLAVIEACWVLSGRNDLEPLEFAAGTFRAFSDDGVTLFGAYGHRLRKQFGVDQIEVAIQHLRRDPLSRRVFLNIASATDSDTLSLDIPCNVSIMLRNVDHKLNMTVINRSNDAVFGVPYNIFVFSAIHHYISAKVGIPVGVQLHFSNAMHLYQKNADIAADVVSSFSHVVSRHAKPDARQFMQDLIENADVIASLDFVRIEAPRLREFFKGFSDYRADKDVDKFKTSLADDWLGSLGRAWVESGARSRVALASTA